MGVCVQSCPTLYDPTDCSPPGSSVQGILQARILEWVAMPSSRDLPDPGTESTSPVSPSLTGRFFTTAPPGKFHKCIILIKFHYKKSCFVSEIPSLMLRQVCVSKLL